MYDNDNIEEYNVSEEWLDYIEAVADELDKQRNEEAKQLEELRKQTAIEKENTAKAKRKTARMRKQANEHFSDSQVSGLLKKDFDKQKKLEREKSKILKNKNSAISKAVGGAFGKTGRTASSVLGLSEISTAAAAITGVTAAFTALTTAAIKVTRATASYNQEMSASAAALGGVSNDSSGLTESLRGLSNAWSLLNEAIGNSKFGEFVEQFNKFITEGLLGAAAWINTGNPANDYKAGATKYENWATALSQQYGVEYSKADILKMFGALMYGKSEAGFGGDVAEAFGQKMTEKLIDYGAMHEGVNVTQMAAEYASMLKNGGTSKYSGVAIDDKIMNAIAYQKYGVPLDVLGERPRQQLAAEEINRQHELAAKGDTKALLDSQAALRQFGEIIRDVGKSLFAFDEVINVSAKLYDAEESLGGFDNRDSNNLEDAKDDLDGMPGKLEGPIDGVGDKVDGVGDKVDGAAKLVDLSLKNAIAAVREGSADIISNVSSVINNIAAVLEKENSSQIESNNLLNQIGANQTNLVNVIANIAEVLAATLAVKTAFDVSFPETSAWDGKAQSSNSTANSTFNKRFPNTSAWDGKAQSFIDFTSDIDLSKLPEANKFNTMIDNILAPMLMSMLGYIGNVGKASGAADNITQFVSKTPLKKAMAVGGVVTAPTNALIGEAGREAVIPLENSGGIEYLKNALIEAGAGNGGNTTVNVTLSGQILEMNDYNVNKLANRIGAAIDNYTNRRGGINYTK